MRGVLREWRGLIITGPDRGISPLNMSRAKCTRNINIKKAGMFTLKIDTLKQDIDKVSAGFLKT